MKKSLLFLGFFISLLVSCPPPTPVPGPDEGGSGSGSETAKEFTVSFDANGGTGTIAPMKVKAGAEITLPDGTAFSRKYYTFNYWTISGSDFYEAGGKYTVKADTVFSAAWRHNQVLITYDSNHGVVNIKEETWTNAGSDLILPGNLFGSSPSGKHFYGWTTAATATETEILAPGSAFRVEETALTFYAYWGDNPVTAYTVTFYDTKMEPITFNQYTEEIRLPLYTGEPGLVCKGWDTDAAAKTVVYEDGGIIPKEKLTGNIGLYPILEDIRVALTWEKNGSVSPDNSDFFPDQAAPGDLLFMAHAVTKDSGDGKVWILDSVTAKTVSGQTVPTRKEMMDGFEIWYISVPAEATVITLNWKEKTDVTVTSLTVEENYEYTEGDQAIDFWFIYKADFDPAKGNLKITKDGKEVEILSYHHEPYTAEEKVGYCELSPAAGAGQYQLQIIVNGNVLKEASFNVTFTEGGDPTTPQTHTVTFNAGNGTGTVDPITVEAGTVITLPSAEGLSRQYYTFTAWETGGQQYNPDADFTVNADTVFTAVWTRNTITVTYEAGNTSVTPSTHTETVDAGGSFRLPENPFDNSPAGQIFYGWALTQTPQESEILNPNTEYTAGETDITFYAVWKEPVTITLTYIKNGAEAYPAYEDAFPVAVNQGATVMLKEMYYFKNDGDTPYILTGIKVFETDNPSVTLTVTPGNEEQSGSCWSFQAGTEALTVELLWEEQSISNYSFQIMWATAENNYLDVACLTDIALSPGMITVTDGNDNPLTPFQKMTTCAQIQNGMRTHSCVIEFAENIPAGTYKVIFTVSGQTIHTETITVSEAQP